MKTPDIMSLLESELRAANAIGKGFSKEPEKLLRSGLARTAMISKSFARMLKAQDFGGLDDFFFAREDLVPGGKEYWFIDVVSTRGDRTQLVLTFGRSDAKAVVNRSAAEAGRVAAVGWFYSGKKKVFLDSSVELECKKGTLKSDAFTFSGAYPSYDLVVGSKTKLHFSKQKKGIAYDAQPCTAGNLGVGLLSMYLDAKGVIDGRRFTGVGYVQKVVVVAPFIPWNWVRVVFRNRSVLDVFVARLDVRGLEYGVQNIATFRPASGRTFKLRNARFRKLAGDRWLLEGDGFAAYLKTYAFKPFMLKGRGEFHYDEYLVECADFVYKGKSMQGGIGMIEDAYGFMI